MISRKFRRFFSRNRPQFILALRNTAAALAALAVAVWLRLESPYWAAMTALIVIQPTRGLLFEKSLYRLIGTATGALAGLLLLQERKVTADLSPAESRLMEETLRSLAHLARNPQNDRPPGEKNFLFNSSIISERCIPCSTIL
ncbi:fusaric acid resistance protein [Desulfuromonas soudanensis]|uniref:Fusaric acid resistance protein n=1 Tax=Desulfuromonas soudanensis TaxID=1603606 RepID=A0A0M4CVU8_9BACT|nr:FUSC family protein [Desulfuromonas soudanensis]ALC15954.1 fusaric acid resistance protein [Desulfuromonas soudanensis]